MNLLYLIVSAALLVPGISAHGGVWNYSIAGEWQPGFFPYYPAEGQSSIQRHWENFQPILDVASPYLTCNEPGNYAERYANITAGSEIKAYFKAWPHDIGPIITWMAYCGAELDGCSSFNGSEGNHWFKIDQVGLESGTVLEGEWAQRILLAGNFTWNVTIPEDLMEGAYLIRHEIIALHVPYEAEFYPECAHLYVQGGGGEVPGEEYLTSIPGVYDADGEILIIANSPNIFADCDN
ncbi:hypothetical protein AJ80_00003 [Polytolypa hystricis UAMH7299]|uniref:AA9 family lytic polysaccharide monooxygenase n=1 Tax=Polytolypa hystricis (strain UAMH7299) TaxID=1447883 RepID=A0A2B7YVK0_POLH7|nr:hypothetical protein AJ80_00003 [Polytolypa hystricis UAMH7299]